MLLLQRLHLRPPAGCQAIRKLLLQFAACRFRVERLAVDDEIQRRFHRGMCARISHTFRGCAWCWKHEQRSWRMYPDPGDPRRNPGEILVTRISCSPLARRREKKVTFQVLLSFPDLCPLRSVSQQVCASQQAWGRTKGMLFHLIRSPLSSGEQNLAIGWRKKVFCFPSFSPPALRLTAGVRFPSTSPGPSQGHVVSPDELAAFERRAELCQWRVKKGFRGQRGAVRVYTARCLLAGY